VETSASTRKAARAGRGIGHLEVPRLGLEAAVVEGVDDRSLLGGVGHVPGTSFPGERDNVALAGHRDTHSIRCGRSFVATRSASHRGRDVSYYAVDKTFIVHPGPRRPHVRPTGRPMLTLITCYPFGWIGTAPERFVVAGHTA
jgi:sortase A